MTLGRDDIQKIAILARLEVNAQELEHYTQTLSQILGLIDQMNAVDTSSVSPMAHPQDVSLRLREDRVGETDRREQFQKIAPETENGLYLVPRVIE
ncbi:MAG: Asp-tRNA(Asn)/Glu-tRNA(Gln) amidotransferase subunit GatC [Gammaproteobacteria bacterium]|nr:MAG: Asp-tRNA(Asn)/Glu-tRNA(Gln) amidotransferase subunit GatC [Gammaproteobacteria bacterium]